MLTPDANIPCVYAIFDTNLRMLFIELTQCFLASVICKPHSKPTTSPRADLPPWNEAGLNLKAVSKHPMSVSNHLLSDSS